VILIRILCNFLTEFVSLYHGSQWIQNRLEWRCFHQHIRRRMFGPFCCEERCHRQEYHLLRIWLSAIFLLSTTGSRCRLHHVLQVRHQRYHTLRLLLADPPSWLVDRCDRARLYHYHRHHHRLYLLLLRMLRLP